MTYNSVHNRFNETDPASNHVCGCGHQAKDWAYQHNSLEEVYDEKSGRPYSENPDDYLPMCRSCHFKLDATELHQKLGRALGLSNVVRAQADEQFAAQVSEDRAKAARIANQIKRTCDECGLTAHPAAIGAHQKGSGHRGYTDA